MTTLSYLVYASAGITIIGATPSALRAAHWLWQRTIPGRRRKLRQILDRLACGSTQEFVHDLLGPPKFVGKIDGRPQQHHRLDGAWVTVELIDGIVLAFSITISDSRLSYPINAQTHLTMHGSLGQSSFSQIREHASGPVQPGGQLFWVGAYRWVYNESYYHGRPGAYQYYWLSHNMAGVGSFKPASTGTFAAGSYENNGSNDVLEMTIPPDRSSITVNTLTVMNSAIGYASALQDAALTEQFFARGFLGTDSEILRLDVTRFRRTPGRAILRYRNAFWHGQP